MKLANVIKRFVSGVILKEGVDPDTPSSGDRHLYAKDDGIYARDSDGNVIGPFDKGDVSGPESSTDGHLAVWDGTDGTTLQDSGITVDDSDNVAGVKSLTWTSATELTIATGAITVTQELHRVDTEGDAASDDLVTINGGADGLTVMLRAENAERTVVLKDGTGNLELGGADVSLDDTDKWVKLCYDGTLTKWLIVGGVGAGVGTFDDLTDTPASKSGAADNLLCVNVGETAVEYRDEVLAWMPTDFSSLHWVLLDTPWATVQKLLGEYRIGSRPLRSFRRSAMGADLSGTSKWIGGALGPDGKIYGIPYDSTDILIIDLRKCFAGELMLSGYLNKF